jgi:hypothetical protein
MRDVGIEARAGQRARGRLHGGDLDIVDRPFAPDADHMHRQARGAQCGDGLLVESAIVVGAVGDQDDRANRQRGGLAGGGFQRVAQPRGGSTG